MSEVVVINEPFYSLKDRVFPVVFSPERLSKLRKLEFHLSFKMPSEDNRLEIYNLILEEYIGDHEARNAFEELSRYREAVQRTSQAVIHRAPLYGLTLGIEARLIEWISEHNPNSFVFPGFSDEAPARNGDGSISKDGIFEASVADHAMLALYLKGIELYGSRPEFHFYGETVKGMLATASLYYSKHIYGRVAYLYPVSESKESSQRTLANAFKDERLLPREMRRLGRENFVIS